MAKIIELFGHPIIPHRQITFAQQVHKIFIEEIHNGRWKVGERLPGVAAIIRDTGLGNKTVQEAFTLLKEDGYVKAEPYKGTFLSSILPKGIDPEKGRIGILLSSRQASDPYALWMSHIFMDATRRQGLVGEVRIVNPGDDIELICSKQGPFSEDIVAIISLVPCKVRPDFEQGPNHVPVLFFCSMVEECRPMIAVDVIYSYYILTRRSLNAGHRKIAFIADAGMDPRFTELHRRGYFQAMNERGLEGEEYSVNRDDAAAVKRLFKKLLDGNRVTEIMCGSLALAQQILPMAKQMGVDIPGRISLVSIGSCQLEGEQEKCVTGMILDFDYLTTVSFELLNEMIRTGRCRQAKVLLVGRFVPGDTFRPLIEDETVALPGDIPVDVKGYHSLQNLSSAIYSGT